MEDTFPSKLKYYEEVKYTKASHVEWKGDSEMLVPFHSDKRYSQFYMD